MINLKTIAAVVIMSCPAAYCQSEADAQKLFDRANRLYESGNYPEAVECYQTVISSGLENEIAYYNLGNAYYRENRIGKAVLNYERALKISPRDEDIKYNLRFVRAMVNEPEEGFLAKTAGVFNIRELTVFCALVYYFFIFMLIIRIFRRDERIKLAAIISGCVLICSLAWWYALYSLNEKPVYGIVTSSPAEARTGPGRDYSVGFTMPEGKKVYILNEKEGWYAIAVRQAEQEGVLLKGWISKDLIEKI